MHEAVASLCAGRDPVDRHEAADRGRHGRQEHRRVEVFEVADRLPPEWEGMIACAARVSRLSWCKDTRTGLWAARREVAYHVSQVRLDAEGFGRAVRAHWGIENRSHHVHDPNAIDAIGFTMSVAFVWPAIAKPRRRRSRPL